MAGNVANLTNAGKGRVPGSKNKISVKVLTNLQTKEAVKEQWDALIDIIKTGKHSDKIQAIKLIWTYTIELEDDSEEKKLSITELQEALLATGYKLSPITE